jgi:putative transposase
MRAPACPSGGLYGSSLRAALSRAAARALSITVGQTTSSSGTFDEIFRSEGIRVIKAPVRAPKARAHAERWVGSARRECLDRLLILGRRHLQHVLAAYTRHYNEHRPHRSLRQHPPLSARPPSNEQATASIIDLEQLRRRDLLGGLIHEYRLAA